MNNQFPSPFDMLEANLLRLEQRGAGRTDRRDHVEPALVALGRGVAAMLEQQIRPFGLAEAEFRVLTALFSQPEGAAHPSELCARPRRARPTCRASAMCSWNRDLITRVSSEQDRRRMVLRITEQGEELVRRLLPLLFAPLRDLFKDLSDAEQQQLIAQLKRLGMKLEEPVSVQAAEHPL